MTPASSNMQLPAHGGQLHRLAADFGIDPSELVDFSANINPLGPPASVAATLASYASDPARLTAYPDLDYTGLRAALARYTSKQPEQIAVANGFAPLLDAVLAVLQPTGCVLPVPAFSEYRFCLERARIPVYPVAAAPEDFTYRPDVLIEAALRHTAHGRAPALLVTNPQNPSAALTPLPVMLQLAERTRERGIPLLVDEAFIDYAPEHSLLPSLADFPHVIVLRSVTKFFAVPALRVAYLATAVSRASNVRRNVPPWSISTPAADAVAAAVRDTQFCSTARLANHSAREELAARLRETGLHVYPSAANFLLLRLPAEFDADEVWRTLLTRHGVLTRNCANFEGLAPGHLRACVHLPGNNARLIEAFRDVLSATA